ncbi:MAG: hypothetical protein U0796_22180 [Gemmatales bacterium]
MRKNVIIALLAALVACTGCKRDELNRSQLKITGTPATIVGKMIRNADGRIGCYLVVAYHSGHRLAGSQEQVLVDEVVYRHAKVNTEAYIGQNNNGTPVILEYIDEQ